MSKSTTPISFLELSPVLIHYFIGFFIFRGFFDTFPLYLQLKFNMTDVETVGLWAQIGGVAFFVGAATRLPAGLLSDRIGRMRAFALGYTLYITSLLLIYFFQLPLVYTIALGAIRFGVNTFAMTGRAIVSAAKRDKGLKNGLLSSMVGLGSFLGPYLFASILEHYPPDTIIFVGIFLILLDITFFIVALKVVPEFFKSRYPEFEMEIDFAPVVRRHRLHLAALGKNGVWEAMVLFTCAGLIYGLITSVYAIYGYNILELSLSLVGLISGAGPLVQVFWAPTVGKLYDYVKDEDVRVIGWLFAVLATVCVSMSKLHLAFYVMGFIMINLAVSTYFTMEITRIGRIVDRGEFSFVFGIVTSLSILGTAISNYLSPIFYSRSPEGTFIASTVLSTPALALVVVMRKKHLRERLSHHSSPQKQ